MGPPMKDELPIVKVGEKPKIVTSRSPRILIIVLAITVVLTIGAAVVLIVSIPMINGSNAGRNNTKTDTGTQDGGKSDTATTMPPSIRKTTTSPQTTTVKDESEWKWKAEDNCRYNPGTWSECNPKGIATRDDTVTSTSDPACYPERIKNKFCATGETCLYGVSAWGDCTPDGKSWKSIAFLKGDSSCEQVHKVQDKMCTFDSDAERLKWKSEKDDNCAYNLGTWSECNPRGMATREDMLKNTSSPHCFAERVKNKICATASTCLYGITDWSPCDEGGRSWKLIFYLKGDSSCEIAMKKNSKVCS